MNEEKLIVVIWHRVRSAPEVKKKERSSARKSYVTSKFGLRANKILLKDSEDRVTP